MAIGISGGASDLVDFTNWKQSNDEMLEKKAVAENLIVNRLIQMYKENSKGAKVDAPGDKNSGPQLTGVLMDILTWWQKTIADDASEKNICFINSQGTTFSNDLQPRGITNRITQEFKFFDANYF